MTFNISWDNADHVILRHDVIQGWTWQDFRKAKVTADGMIDQTDHPVGVMFVLPDSFKLPPNSIVNTRSAIINRHPRASVLVLVTSNQHVKNLYDILAKVYPPTADIFFLCNTVEEAREKINQRLASHQSVPTP